ncbi:MAG TPA: class I SAM-dependent methyltransferase [Candidatus Methanoperedens sp.]
MEHYDKKYFDWQKNIGMLGATANLDKFVGFVKPEFKVMDFGCGERYLPANLECKGKIGIEINPIARDEARSLGITVYEKIEELTDKWADLIISNNALEHTEEPLSEVIRLTSKLKKGGLMVFVVACESINYNYKLCDINQHLYSWSSMCIGNLFNRANLEVISSKPYIHKWPPYSGEILRFFGRKIFNTVCRVYGRIERSWFQVRIVARKP